MPTYTVNLDESDLSPAFNDYFAHQQADLRRIISEYAKLVEENNRLKKENTHLREENTRLSADDAGSVRRGGGAASNQPPQVSTHGRSGAVIAGGKGGQVIQEEGTYRLVRDLKYHSGPVHSVTIDQNTTQIATASWDATVQLFDLKSNDVVRTLGDDADTPAEEKMGGLYAVAYAKTCSTDNPIIGCTSCDKSVYLWNVNQGKRMSKLTGHTDEVNGIDFHSSQQVMCTASDDCKVIIWDFQEGITLRTLDKHTKAVYGATFLGQENQYYVATCCFDQKTRVFDMRDKQVVALLQTHTDDVIGIDYTSAKQYLATGSDDGLICIWDSRTWKLQQKINTRDDPNRTDNEVKRVAFSRDGQLLAAACSSGRVAVYDMAQTPSPLVADLGGHSDCVFDVAWGNCPTTGKKILVSASHDHTSKYWREN